jgi:hypothetical protein
MKRWIWNGKPWQAFKNFAILFSFTLNLILLAVLILLIVVFLPAFKNIAEPIVRGLNQSFADMEEARIVHTVSIEGEIPVVFDLPLSTETTAIMSEAVPMAMPTSFVLPGGGGTINGVVEFDLPAGTELPIHLEMIVPVNQQLPVSMGSG